MKQYVTVGDKNFVIDGNAVCEYHTSPYAFDIDKITEPFDAFIHAMAITAAITNRWNFTIFPAVDEIEAIADRQHIATGAA